MRDLQKMKEKFELSLDGRQMVTLTLVGLVAVGGVFALGLAVGKKLAREEQVAPQPDLLAALDAHADAQKPGGAGADPALTFQEELTRKAPVLVMEKPIIKSTPRVIEKVAERTVELPAPEARPVVDETPLPTSTTDSAGRKLVPTTTLALEPAPAAVRPPEPRAPEAKPAPRPAPEVMVNTRPADDGGPLREAIARASRPALTSPDGSWTLQLSAYQDRAEADRYLAGLRDRGYAPYVVEAQVPNKGTWYRVRMGRFPSRDAATQYLTDFQRETKISAFVTNVQ